MLDQRSCEIFLLIWLLYVGGLLIVSLNVELFRELALVIYWILYRFCVEIIATAYQFWPILLLLFAKKMVSIFVKICKAKPTISEVRMY